MTEERKAELGRLFKSRFELMTAVEKAAINNLIVNGEDSNYHAKSDFAKFQDRLIIVTHLKPKLTEKQRETAMREIESGLYEVFEKYQKK